MSFKVGQKVVCVLNFPDRGIGETMPKKNEIYTVRELYGHDSIFLLEISNTKRGYKEGVSECSFHVIGFRPLDYDFVEEVIEQVKPKEVETSLS